MSFLASVSGTGRHPNRAAAHGAHPQGLRQFRRQQLGRRRSFHRIDGPGARARATAAVVKERSTSMTTTVSRAAAWFCSRFR